jgi:hypothetical protein
MNRAIKVGLGLMLLVGLPGLAGCTTPVEVIQVTTTADVVADDDVTSLREAFAHANRSPNPNRIEFMNDGTYELTNCVAGALVHTTASTLDVVGAVTIRQTCPDSGIMASTQATSVLGLTGVTLMGGPNTGVTMAGAGINVRGALRMGIVTVTGVDAGPGGTVVDVTGGPAEQDVTLDMSSINGNTGTGLSLRDGGVELFYSWVQANTGDGVHLLGTSTYKAHYSYVDANTGWGLDVRGTGDSVVWTEDAGFRGNGGGGIACTGCVRMSLIDSFVLDNGAAAAEGSGGGIAFQVVQGESYEQPMLEFLNGFVVGNRARRAGGGIFAGNSESSPPGLFGPTVRVFSTSVTGNSTTGGHHGGGIAVTAGELAIGGNQITDNVAGGAGSDGGGVYFREPVDEFGYRNAFSASGDLMARNRAGGNGGAVAVDTDDGITMNGSDINGNVAAGNGGGAHIRGDAILERMHVRGNLATDGGGALMTAPDRSTDVTVSGSTFEVNTARAQGGGFAANGVRSLHVLNSTVDGNAALLRGGGAAMADDPPGGVEELYLHFSTVTGNSATLGANVASEVRLETYGSIVVEPVGGGANCAVDPGDRYPRGYSFVSDASCGFHPTDVISAEDPQLGPLTDDGFTPPTRTPAPTGPLAGMVPVVACDEDTDQRGTPRPQGDACEAGSVEIVEAVDGGTPSGSLARL